MSADAKAGQVAGGIRRSILAIVAGLLINIVAALALDQLFHMIGVYPPWDEPMNEPGDNVLALAYRILIAIGASYVTARLAPSAPMRHALLLGAIGFVLSSLGAIVAANMALGPLWYPLLLVAITLPCAWIGARLAMRTEI